MRICICYDGVFPYTLGGADRWYRNVAERMASLGHDVTYVTTRQWEPGQQPRINGVSLVAVAPNVREEGAGGRRRTIFPLIFGAGFAWHLVRRGRSYDVVHMAAFPYTTMLAAALLRPIFRYQLVVDWHESFTRDYWQELAGRGAGWLAWQAQRLCARIPHRAVAFSRLHADRVRRDGHRAEVNVFRGQHPLQAVTPASESAVPLVVFAGRHVPEKRVLNVVRAVAIARQRIPGLQGVIFGDGEQRPDAERLVSDLGLGDCVRVTGMVADSEVTEAMRRALCLIHPSRREGFGFAVVEALALGTPVIVVAGPDNAATELVDDGVNGFVAKTPQPDELAEAIVAIFERRDALRVSTSEWFERHTGELALETSIARLLELYAPAVAAPEPALTNA
jgi:glycosyltransferase involved in cell wall biosynthesis